jgi:hypothetical protein
MFIKMINDLERQFRKFENTIIFYSFPDCICINCISPKCLINAIMFMKEQPWFMIFSGVIIRLFDNYFVKKAFLK